MAFAVAAGRPRKLWTQSLPGHGETWGLNKGFGRPSEGWSNANKPGSRRASGTSARRQRYIAAH